MIWPVWPCWRGRVWRFIKFNPSTTILPSRGMTANTLPFLARSLPESITTLSPLWIFMVSMGLDDFLGQRSDGVKSFFFYLARNRAENAATFRFGAVQQHNRVVVKPDISTVLAAERLALTD